jgi:diguanylate cyclase
MDLDLMKAAAGLAALAVTGVAGGTLWMRRRHRATRNNGARAQQAAEAALDPSTGLMTRVRFELAVQDGLSIAQKRGLQSCVLHVVVDGFRLAKDIGGAAVASKVLAVVAQRLQAACGESTPLARMGNDEFAVWLDAPREAGENLAVRITESFAAPASVEGRDFELVVSVGLAVAPMNDAGPRLPAMAAAAAHAVQRSGGGAHSVFDARIAMAHNEELSIARELNEAAAKRQLELFFQPQIDARKLEVATVEALLRWRHPAMGLVSPARFIPVAERQGMMESLGQWILDGAIKQAAAWRSAGLRFRVAVNISGVQFRQDDFVPALERGLKTHRLPGELLTCEIAESVLLESTAANKRTLEGLRKLGVQISIGDFAGGPAGVAALAILPVHEVKLSHDLVAALPNDADARRTVQAVVAAARERGLRVVGEGVESEAQRDHAVQLGCDELQGYMFAKPMSARALTIWSSDAHRNLAQTFQPALFKETQIDEGIRGHGATAFAPTRISLRR